ncbi:vertnin [Callorhinchus milii]|uniref:vertnin n=1 Tax=Callorhinchus milii TaxID=7868 RepID=UPI001C3F5FFC|nr:vertnin [Callorhinchus milii]
MLSGGHMDAGRAELVDALRCKLQEATEWPDPDYLRAVTSDVGKLLSSFSVPSACERNRNVSMGTEVDLEAKALYPEDAPMDMVPLSCQGQGNHLFEAASVSLLGDSSLSAELQVRTMVEMLLHKQYYLKGMIDSKIMLQAARFSLCTEESAARMDQLPMAILEAIFDADVKATCFPGTFSNMWHIYALASVLQRDVYSIYPMSNMKIRPYFNRIIRPRARAGSACQSQTLHVMWAGESLSRSVFRPQYFAPVVPVSTLHCPSSGEALPRNTLELLNMDPDISYSMLREKYSITKSTFYRWKRQSWEHRQKAATRYEAKQYLQQCFSAGSFLPLQQFRTRFPEVSRSTYYTWKHEMLLGAGVRVPGLDAGIPGANENQSPLSGGSENTESSKLHPRPGFPRPFNSQRSPSMQLVKSFLRNCVSLNMCPPYKSFRKTYPWISRSTYYNWRREAMTRVALGPKDSATGQIGNTLVGLGDLQLPSLYKSRAGSDLRSPFLPLCGSKSNPSPLQRTEREEAKRRVQKWRMPHSVFRVRYRTISSSTYFLWRRAAGHQGAGLRQQRREGAGLRACGETGVSLDRRQHLVAASTCLRSGMFSLLPAPAKTFNVTSLSKAEAKLFLQQRFESNTFPTFKEFSGFYPLTPRSTYYMWKRALINGMVLTDY